MTVVLTASDFTGSAEQSEVDDTQAGTVDTPALPTTEPSAPPLTQETPTEPAPAKIPSLYSDISELDLDVLYEVWDIVERQFDGDLPAEEDFAFLLD
ncbi:MAG: hypothetical protein R3E31_18105 [Chloroflexota bacterium]